MEASPPLAVLLRPSPCCSSSSSMRRRRRWSLNWSTPHLRPPSSYNLKNLEVNMRMLDDFSSDPFFRREGWPT